MDCVQWRSDIKGVEPFVSSAIRNSFVMSENFGSDLKRLAQNDKFWAY
jgi:hypothetical protein